MIQTGIDWGFVGQAYEAPMLLQDAQRCINWYCEVSEDKTSKMPIALLGCPGLNPLAQPGAATSVRACWPLPGGTQCLWVIGNTVWVQTITVPATQTSIAQFSYGQVGTLNTNNGPVYIRDNGVVFGGQGGYALLTDGVNGYFYRIAGAGTVSFTGGVSSTSTTITLPGSLPIGLIIGSGVTLSDSGGAVPANTTISSINYNAPSITMSAAATATVASDTITVSIPQFGQITDPGFPTAPGRIAFIEGWLIVNQVGTRTFQTNGTTPYSMTWPGSFFALKDSSTDNLITLQENNRELWLIGERTSEVWYNAGGQNFAFQRIPAVGPQIGCSAMGSLTRMGPDLIWLASNEQGQNIVVKSNQYAWERLSTHAIEHAIASYPLVSDAIGYAYEEEGHFFYMLTFPTADVTWVYDGKTKLWHQRLSYNPGTGQYHRHRSNCYCNFANLRLVGDYTSGQIHQMSRQFYTDAGAPLRCQRRAPHVWKKADRRRLFHGWLQVEFTPGVGLQTGQGSTPEAMLRWSNDGGFTWSNEYWNSIGAAGQTKNRAIWRRLGRARDRIYELNFTDPVPRDVIGVTLFVEPEEEVEEA